LYCVFPVTRHKYHRQKSVHTRAIQYLFVKRILLPYTTYNILILIDGWFSEQAACIVNKSPRREVVLCIYDVGAPQYHSFVKNINNNRTKFNHIWFWQTIVAHIHLTRYFRVALRRYRIWFSGGPANGAGELTASRVVGGRTTVLAS